MTKLYTNEFHIWIKINVPKILLQTSDNNLFNKHYEILTTIKYNLQYL